MRYKTSILAGCICAIGVLFAPLAQALTTTQIVQLAKPAVVLIECNNSQNPSQSRLGTGFFVNSDTIITNDHVMRGTYDRVSVHKLDGTFFNIDYIAYTSPQEDICVLKTKEKYNLAFLSLSTVDPVEGESIVVIGNPEGLTGTISQGIVSALRPGGVMQITAPITHGSSGSPVLSMDGKVVGIVDRSADQDEANIGFARDLVTIEHVLSWAKDSRLGDAFSLATAPARSAQTTNPPVVTNPASAPSADVDRVAELIQRYMLATQNGKPLSLTPFTTLELGDWYGQGKLSMQKAEESIAGYYKAYPIQSTSFDISNAHIVPVGNKALNGHAVYEVELPFNWSAQGKNGTRKSGTSTLQALVAFVTITDGSGGDWRIYAIHNLK